MQRKPLLIANWKLNHTRVSATNFFAEISSYAFPPSIELAIAPVAPMLEFVAGKLGSLPISLAAQNVFYEEKGAFTGEWSAQQLFEAGVTWCIIGHSERRKIFFETDDDVRKKTSATLRAGLMPVICVGESLEERESGSTHEIITRQVNAVLSAFTSNDQVPVFAYEPVWAIGTGKTATSEQAQEVHLLIRTLLREKIGKSFAENTRILYGGSVNSHNIQEIIHMPDVDGALVGGASLQAESFLSMVNQLHDA